MTRNYRRHGGDPNHPDFPHGKFAGWRSGCRCSLCIEGHRDYKKKYTKNLRSSNLEYAKSQRLDKRRYRKTSKGKAVASKSCAKRRAIKQQVTVEESKLISIIYDHCPIGYHVDHIIPLSRGGPYTSNNLQYLPASINYRKHNSIDFDSSPFAIKWQDIVNFNDYPLKGVDSSESKQESPK